jgi:hypothetical protein
MANPQYNARLGLSGVLIIIIAGLRIWMYSTNHNTYYGGQDNNTYSPPTNNYTPPTKSTYVGASKLATVLWAYYSNFGDTDFEHSNSPVSCEHPYDDNVKTGSDKVMSASTGYPEINFVNTLNEDVLLLLQEQPYGKGSTLLVGRNDSCSIQDIDFKNGVSIFLVAGTDWTNVINPFSCISTLSLKQRKDRNTTIAYAVALGNITCERQGAFMHPDKKNLDLLTNPVTIDPVDIEKIYGRSKITLTVKKNSKKKIVVEMPKK